MLRDLEEFLFAIVQRLHHPKEDNYHSSFTFGHVLALCFPPGSPGQVHHIDLLAWGGDVFTLGLVPVGEGDDQEGTCVLELNPEDKQVLDTCTPKDWHVFLLTLGTHVFHNANNAYGALESWQENEGKAHLRVFRAWCKWLLGDGPASVPLVQEADRIFKPLADHVDSSVGMMIPNVWHKGGANRSSKWRVIAFLFVGSAVSGGYNFERQLNSVTLLAWAYGDLSVVLASHAVQWELCMGVRVCATQAQPEDSSAGRKEFYLGVYLQHCTDLAVLLLVGCNEKNVCMPCIEIEGKQPRVASVRLAPPAGGEDLVVSSEDKGRVDSTSNLPYGTEIAGWGSLQGLRSSDVDAIVRMFMRVVCFDGDHAATEGFEVAMALWWDAQEYVQTGKAGGRVDDVLRMVGQKKRKQNGWEEGVKGKEKARVSKVEKKVTEIRRLRSMHPQALTAPPQRYTDELRGLRQAQKCA
mmetsp:Transcript_41787/g.81686  ORF Transcript_41787/g.81686 Transcript_41787/m.81686 type:complete len:466 (-) Transcript_41787:1840-3237(-)